MPKTHKKEVITFKGWQVKEIRTLDTMYAHNEVELVVVMDDKSVLSVRVNANKFLAYLGNKVVTAERPRVYFRVTDIDYI